MQNKIIGALFLLTLSCSAPKEIVRLPVKTEDITPETIVKKHLANGADLKFIKTVVTIQLQSPQSGNQFSAQIALKLPDSAYIKIEGILGIDGLKASINRNTYVVYNIINKRVSLGRTNSDAIRKTFDMDVSFDDMVGLLYGLPKIHPERLDSMSEFSADSTYYVMTFIRDGRKQKIWFDPYAGFAISKIIDYSEFGDVLMEREFTRFYEEGGSFYPKYVRLSRPLKEDFISLYFDARELNKSFNSSIFQIRYPKDTEIIRTN